MRAQMSAREPFAEPIALPVARDVAADPCDAEVHVIALFDDYQRPLLRYLVSLGLEPHQAEDVVQDVFVALFQHLRRGRPRHNLPGWLFQVAHNLGLRQRRAHQRRWWFQGTSAAATPDAIDPAANPETRLAEAEQRLRWQRVLRALPERDRRCVVLRAEGHAYRAIAAFLDVSLGSVAKSIARALERLERVDEG